MKVRSILNALLLLFAVLLLIFGTRPLYNEGKSVETIIPTRQEVLAEKQTLKRRLDKLRETLGQIEEEAKLIEQIVPTEPRIPDMIISIESIASRNGMILRNVRFGKTSRNPRFYSGGAAGGVSSEYFTMQITMSLAGSYEALEGFLRDVERSLRLVDISSISMSSSTDEVGEARNTFEFSVQADTYYLK